MPQHDTNTPLISGRTARRARRIRWIALAAVWLVGACAMVEEEAAIPESVAAVPLGAPPPRSEPPRGPIEPPVAKLDDDPEQVIGLDDAALEALLGRPAFRRDDSPALIWQYRSDGCLLDVFLYTDGPAKPHRAVYYEVRGAATGEPVGPAATRSCFRSLLLASGAG